MDIEVREGPKDALGVWERFVDRGRGSPEALFYQWVGGCRCGLGVVDSEG